MFRRLSVRPVFDPTSPPAARRAR